MVGENSKTRPDASKIREIQAREEEIDRQLVDMRKRLSNDAARRMVDVAKEDSTAKVFLAQYISDKRTEEELVVRSLGQDLMSYQQRLDDLKEQQSLLNRMRTQVAIEKANRYIDDTRIAQGIETPAEPKEPVVPKWYWYFPFGAAGGFLLTGLGIMTFGRRQTKAAT